MTEKIPVLITYALIGLLLALWPLAVRRSAGSAHKRPSVPDNVRASKLLVTLGVVCGLLIARVLPWWRHTAGGKFIVSIAEMALFAVIVVIFTAVFLRAPDNSEGTSPLPQKVSAVQNFIFAIGVAILSFSTLTYVSGDVLFSAWHHWGAYIGPSELLLAGARIFRDFPPQYGLGPTLLIASVCGKNCWVGTHYLVGIFTLLFALGVTTLALRVTKPKRLMLHVAVLLLCVACCFFWNSFPVMGGSPTAFPSVNGMRFLPALVLTILLIQFDRDNEDFPYWIGHLCWAFAALWSIESAFYATCIWWPHFMLVRQARKRSAVLPTLLRSTGILVLNLGLLTACFLMVYWLAYGTTPTAQGLFAYVLSPPGALPINFKGTIWFFAAALTLSTWVNWRSFQQNGNTAALRQGILLSLLAYATFSYFLGRSHDNNVLNLLPFILLMLLHAWARTAGFAKGLSVGLLACLLGWLSVFNWNAWQTGARASPQTWFDPLWIRGALPEAEGQALFPKETLQVIARTQSLLPAPVTVVGPFLNPSSSASNAVWSVFHGPANLYSFPSALRREFLHQGAATLQRSGWLVVEVSQPDIGLLVEDFDSVYARTQVFAMSGYLAVHYTARRP